MAVPSLEGCLDWSAAIEHVRQGRTLSGIELEEVEALRQSFGYLDGYAHHFWDYFHSTFGSGGMEAGMARAFALVHACESVGDFIDQPAEQLAALAAFGLVAIDRLAQHAATGGSGWDVLHLYDQIAECHEYTHHSVLATYMNSDDASAGKLYLSNANRRAAHKRHLPTNTAKQFVIEEWNLHRDAYQQNKSAFARDYVRRLWNERHLSVTEKTIREAWLADTPSARKQAG